MKNPITCADVTISITLCFYDCVNKCKKNRTYAILLLLLFFHSSIMVSSQVALHSVYLIGDAGNDTLPGPVLKLLESELEKNPNGTVVFLGDNIYPQGLDGKKISEKRLLSQLEILKQFYGKAFFIPGNHDWKAGKWKGKKCLKEEEKFIDSYLVKETKAQGGLFPKNGLPGPYTLMLSEKTRLVCIDTQWWLQSQFFHKVGKLNDKSKKQTSEIFFTRLDSIITLAKNNNELVFIVAHHPMYSAGNHSLRLEPFRSLVNYTPLQVFGLLGLNRLLTQGMPQPRYKKMRRKLLASISKYDKVIFASGHEHNIQYFKNGKQLFVVSGSGSKTSPIKRSREGLKFSSDKKGFIKLEYSEKGNVRITAMFPDTTPVSVDTVQF